MIPKATERRKHERIPIKEEAYVVFNAKHLTNIPVIGRIMDISKSGLGFYYEHNEKWSSTPEDLAIIYGNDNFYLNKMLFT